MREAMATISGANLSTSSRPAQGLSRGAGMSPSTRSRKGYPPEVDQLCSTATTWEAAATYHYAASVAAVVPLAFAGMGTGT